MSILIHSVGHVCRQDADLPSCPIPSQVPVYLGLARVLGKQACRSDTGSFDEWPWSSNYGPVLYERWCFCKWCHSCKTWHMRAFSWTAQLWRTPPLCSSFLFCLLTAVMCEMRWKLMEQCGGAFTAAMSVIIFNRKCWKSHFVFFNSPKFLLPLTHIFSCHRWVEFVT